MQCFEDMSGLVIDVGSATDRHSLESTRPVFPLVYATTDMYYVTKRKVLFIMEQQASMPDSCDHSATDSEI